MTGRQAELAIGTVQFGVPYGLTGRTEPVAERDARAILVRAVQGGICRIDTAIGYGDIEQRLPALIDGLEVEVVSKLPSLPNRFDEAQAVAFATGHFNRSRSLFGDRLRGFLLHRAADLHTPPGQAAWNALEAMASHTDVALGISGYAPEEVAVLPARSPTMAQLPGNALDQRLVDASLAPSVELTIRSLFLQGLLLMPRQDALERLPRAAEALARWDSWCEANVLSSAVAALSIAKGLPGVRFCLVGVDSVAQLEEVLEAWDRAEPVGARELRVTDPDIIDPRRWRVT